MAAFRSSLMDTLSSIFSMKGKPELVPWWSNQKAQLKSVCNVKELDQYRTLGSLRSTYLYEGWTQPNRNEVYFCLELGFQGDAAKFSKDLVVHFKEEGKGTRVWDDIVQAEKTIIAGWLMYSYSTIDCNALQKLISEKVGFTVKARYRNILGSAETNKGNKVFAIHLEINASINQIHRLRLRNLFPKLQGNSSDYERAFQPTNQPMMLIPTYANNKSPEVAHQCRKRQEHFLSQIKVVPLENTFQRMVSHYICGTNFSLKDLVESVDIPGTSERLVLSIDQKPFQDYPRLTYHKKLERE